MAGRYITMKVDDSGDLHLIPTEEGIEEARRLVEERRADDTSHMIEDHLGNGWMNVPAEAIGALTGCEDIISEDYTLDDDGEYVPCAPDPVLYWHADYMVEVPVELWSQGREVIFKRA